MIKVNVIGASGWPKDHDLAGMHGTVVWLTLSSAVAIREDHPDGAIILWPCGGGLLIDEDAESLNHRFRNGLVNPPPPRN